MASVSPSSDPLPAPIVPGAQPSGVSQSGQFYKRELFAGWISLSTALTLLAVFTVVTGREAARGHRVRCRCFGAGAARIGPAQLVRNVLLVAAALAGLVIEPGSHGAAGAAGLVVAVGIALLAALALIRWDDLAYLARTS